LTAPVPVRDIDIEHHTFIALVEQRAQVSAAGRPIVLSAA
jgi:hypothetical protein